MNQSIYTVKENKMIAKDTFEMHLEGDTSAFVRPGQFVNIKLPEKFLRRPISVCDWNESGFVIIYKCVGEGTRYMSEIAPGEKLDILVGLGNGFDVERAGGSPLIAGGGVGTPPLYGLAKRLVERGVKPTVFLGFASADDAMCIEKFEALGLKVCVATVDGSLGTKGFITDIPTEGADFSYYYSCGPEPMLRALMAKFGNAGELSFEERMGCGFGACMGCTCKTKGGHKRICREGPVLRAEEVE